MAQEFKNGWGPAAAYVGVSIMTLRRLVKAGRLTQYRLGDRLVRFDVAELDALVQPAIREVPPGGLREVPRAGLVERGDGLAGGAS